MQGAEWRIALFDFHVACLGVGERWDFAVLRQSLSQSGCHADHVWVDTHSLPHLLLHALFCRWPQRGVLQFLVVLWVRPGIVEGLLVLFLEVLAFGNGLFSGSFGIRELLPKIEELVRQFVDQLGSCLELVLHALEAIPSLFQRCVFSTLLEGPFDVPEHFPNLGGGFHFWRRTVDHLL